MKRWSVKGKTMFQAFLDGMSEVGICTVFKTRSGLGPMDRLYGVILHEWEGICGLRRRSAYD